MTPIRDLLEQSASHAADFLEGVDERHVGGSIGVDELRARLGGPLPDGPTGSGRGDRAARGRRGSRARGDGGQPLLRVRDRRRVPAALAADWLTSAWDQNAGLYVAGPSAAVVEEVAGGWIADLLGLPADVSLRLRDGVPDGARHGARGGAARGARARGLGRQRARPHRRPGRPRRCERGAPHDGRPGAALPRPRHRLRGAGRDGRPGPDARGRAAGERFAASRGRRSSPPRPGNVNTGSFDPLERDRRRRRRRRRLAARRRRIRSLGRRLAVASATWSRASSAPTPGRPTPTSG